MTFRYLYDTAFAANKINDIEAGFYWLNKVLEHYQEQDLSWIMKDAENHFYNLMKSSQWESFQQKITKKIATYQKNSKHNNKIGSKKD